MSIPWPKPTPRCSWRTCRAPATHDITAGQAGQGDGYATSYACERHVLEVSRRNTRIAHADAALVVQFDQPIQPVLDLGEL